MAENSAVRFLVTLSVFISIYSKTATALQCYQCVDVETSSSSSLLNNLVSGNSNPGCEDLTQTDTVTCPDDSTYKCSFISSSVQVQELGESVTIKVKGRGCVPDSFGTDNGCQRTTGLTNKLKTVSAILSKLAGASLSVDGDICYCNTDLCDAACSGFRFRVRSTCISWWVVIGSAAAVVVLSVLCCIGCCCCCGCCRSTPATRFVSVQNPGMVVVSTPGGATALSPVPETRHAGYDQPSPPGGVVYSYNQQSDKKW